MSSHADDNRNACYVSRNTLNTFDEDCVVLTMCGDVCNELPLSSVYAHMGIFIL